MFDEKSIILGLAELGYLRLKKLTYKASWSSTEVEHFLFFSPYGSGNYFTCCSRWRQRDVAVALACLRALAELR
jgi:hypothetical protein